MLKSNITSATAISIQSEYAAYQSRKRDGDSHNELADARVHLVRRLIRETKDLVESDIFNSLMEDEVEYIEEDLYDYTKLTKLIAVSRALRMARGIDTLDISQIRDYHELEADLAPEEVPEEDFFIQYRTWLTDQILGLDSQSEAKGRLVNIVSTSSNYLLHYIDRAFPANIEMLKTFNGKLQMASNNRVGVVLNPQNHLNVLMATATLYLMNKSLGDDTNADFFLMKSVILNKKEYEHELLFEYLNNVLLSN